MRIQTDNRSRCSVFAVSSRSGKTSQKAVRACGAYFRLLAARLDRAKAITAVAHKLAHLIYTMLTKGEEYTDQEQDYYEERYRQRVMHHPRQAR